MGCISSRVKALSTLRAKLDQCFASWLLRGSGIIGGLALTAACRDLTTDISQPPVNTLLSPGSICSPVSLPFSSNYKTQNFSPKVQLVVNIFQFPRPARTQAQSSLPWQRPEGVGQQELTYPCVNQSSLLPSFKLHETLQP